MTTGKNTRNLRHSWLRPSLKPPCNHGNRLKGVITLRLNWLTIFTLLRIIPSLAWLESHCWIKNFMHTSAGFFENLGTVFSIPYTMRIQQPTRHHLSNSGSMERCASRITQSATVGLTAPANRLVSILSCLSPVSSCKGRRWVKILQERRSDDIPLIWMTKCLKEWLNV